MVGVAVIGCGYWGPKVARNFSALEDCELVALCDHDPKRLAGQGRFYPGARLVESLDRVLDDPAVDAVSICTPVATHYPIASQALAAGKHVMLEKPMTHSVETALALVRQAEESGLTLHVDHTFVYSGAVSKIRSIVDDGSIGELLYFDSVRINLGLFQSDVNVIWDLAAHDISVMAHLIDQEPVWVSALGSAHYGELESQAYVHVKFENSLVAHLHVNWLAPVKLRSTLIGGSRRMIVYDDLEPSEKIRVYERGVTLTSESQSRERALVDYRIGDMYAPYIDKTEPLSSVCQAFLDAIAARRPSLSDGRAGLAVVRILEAAQRSIDGDGERIVLRPEA